jgi:lipoic acid synthetase
MAKRLGAVTKSGIMIGLGETEEEIFSAFQDLRDVDCDLLTIGQYLQATKNNVPVQKYYPPREFERLRSIAFDTGFIEVVSGPLVRSSYMAQNLFAAIQNQNLEL